MSEPILLVPGMMCDARVFGPQIEDLSRDFALHIARVTRADSIREMAAEAIHHAPARFALAGLSMGGIVAMEILRRVPERVTRFALISTTPLAETPEQAAWREPQIVKAQSGNLTEALRAALPVDSLGPGPGRQKVLAVLDAMAADLGPREFIRQSRALQRRPDAQKVLRMARAPALVLCGGHDKITPIRRHSFMAELIPYAELAIIEEAGHIPTLEAPEKVNMALRAWMDLPMVLR
ncbi:alpha/beta fold hydrolase [Sinisalibacter aestuarii]|uniref:Alpha/beta hydrolase n=1 Tax=Sinisalibacter aestuarii TaxID=2949426 RepID=A0ABQ5LX10_9RHOB|nr:alpha/beta hydrolase [Sinisalibacter aestuarii]GKY89506.1 alpha/beta hydrolase [Sinisalibacter aestuarii]